MPSTYPARELNGILISGFVAIDLNKAVFPLSLIPRLKDIGYRIDIDTSRARQDTEFLFKDLSLTLKSREKTVDALWDAIDWDLFIVVVTGTDRLMHFLWDSYENPNHIYHHDFIDYFIQVDRFIGHIFDRFAGLKGSKDNHNRFLMLSDHGFTGINSEVNLNKWLQENGYLNFQNKEPETIMDMRNDSTAFALDPSRIYIHRKDKYAKGNVDPSDYESIREEIEQGLESLTFNGNSSIFQKIFLKEDLYSGPNLDQAPDLVALSNYGYDLKSRVSETEIFHRSGLQGMHTQDDAFFYSSLGEEVDTIFEIKNLLLN
jgi:predicted AlkP superfamily phosphohydrolase/phosphomutase